MQFLVPLVFMAGTVIRSHAFSLFKPTFQNQHGAERIHRPRDSLTMWLSSPQKQKDSTISETTAIDLSNEEEKYRNRAVLTEALLKKKVSNLKELQNKLEVIQTVVVKLRAKSKESDKYKRDFTQSESERIQAEEALNSLQAEWNRTRTEWEVERDQYQRAQKRVEQALHEEKQRSSVQRKKHRKVETKLTAQVEALQVEVLELDRSLETTEQDLIQMKKEMTSDLLSTQEALNRERRKRLRLEKELAEIATEKEAAQRELEIQQQAVAEQIAIASASVAAAERRESDAIKQMQEVQLLLEKTQPTPKGEISSNETNVVKDYDIETKLRGDIDQLQEQIKSMRKVHNAEIMTMEKNLAKQLEEIQAKYERRIRLLQRGGTNRRGTKEGEANGTRPKGLWDRVKRPFRKRT